MDKPLPKPLYIADPVEGFLDWLADVIWQQVVEEVEQEKQQAEQQKAA